MPEPTLPTDPSDHELVPPAPSPPLPPTFHHHRHPPNNQITQQTQTLTEALTCTTCRFPTPQTPLSLSLAHALRTNLYNPTRDPPFHAPEPDEPISPRTIPDPSPRRGYRALMSATQRHLYATALEALEAGYANTDANAEDAALRARYALDLHIQVHLLVRRGVWTLCRSGEEVEEVRRWRWRVGVMDGLGGGDSRGQEMDGQGQGRKRLTLGGGRGGSNVSAMEMYQLALWKRGWMARRQRVAEARMKWAAIVEERRRQVAARDAKDVRAAAAARVIKVRLYCSHEGCKSLIREVEVEREHG
ncbi:uncharacterized protein ACLA_011150 [Aspergillus clavatus NRRL 1]|uniref:Uncharacterized protein n=1 Tax=Aspergillus clavatus (strain ATCC 1007 / CBS 513.65 / DSM 816 / NCTC 3887 / NRRL 1 / QM 1276 / 107) TaxID=344612 RepID=A1CAC0_ASPCL|nr:uncharacterized protein ACLA_011150 [Aspergillus clavatus NRRL 1]EAW12688.1 hypothetical protein ACLA_011150 [Aspergillus clavatus NRRL 1]